MDEEDEGEYDEDSTRDQREALTQLKKYIEYACLQHPLVRVVVVLCVVVRFVICEYN